MCSMGEKLRSSIAMTRSRGGPTESSYNSKVFESKTWVLSVSELDFSGVSASVSTSC